MDSRQRGAAARADGPTFWVRQNHWELDLVEGDQRPVEKTAPEGRQTVFHGPYNDKAGAQKKLEKLQKMTLPWIEANRKVA